jgi:hypothetical protein
LSSNRYVACSHCHIDVSLVFRGPHYSDHILAGLYTIYYRFYNLQVNFQTPFLECVHPVSFFSPPPPLPALQCACNLNQSMYMLPYCSGLSSEVRKLAQFTLLSNKNDIYLPLNSAVQPHSGMDRHLS